MSLTCREPQPIWSMHAISLDHALNRLCTELNLKTVVSFKVLSHIFLLREDDEEDGNEQLKKASKGTKKLEKFFASKEPTKTSQRHRFFRERGLTPATTL